MGLAPAFARTLDSLLDWIFPPKCGGCGRVGHHLCPQCLAQIAYIGTDPRAVFSANAWSATALRGVRSVAWFEEPLRTAIHNFKYNGQRVLAGPLASLLVHDWERLHHPVDAVIGVPLHPRRQKERGYNQSHLLATEFSRATDIPAANKALRRVRPTLPQVTLTAAERWQNVQGAFQGEPSALAGKSVLLIDDVCTTGATLEACARAALDAGARAVWAMTLCRPRLPDGDRG
ncbi:MAG: ComF family protein [Anaerolineales bacterium]